MVFEFFLAGIAIVIIFSLAFYAGILLSKIKEARKQEKRQKSEMILQQQQRNANICESIRIVARATEQKQCNLSEAAIRLTILLEALLLEKPIAIAKEYPALMEMYNIVKEMPTHEQRNKVPTKELKKLDRQRHLFERQLQERIIDETSRLAHFSL